MAGSRPAGYAAGATLARAAALCSAGAMLSAFTRSGAAGLPVCPPPGPLTAWTGQRVTDRVTSSAPATVAAVTAATDGQAPIRLASGCEAPIAAA
jgi:hypothetical protein